MSTRITQENREFALRYIKKNVIHEPSKKIWMAWCEKVSGKVMMTLLKKFPPEDMKVLDKYGFITEKDYLEFHSWNGGMRGKLVLGGNVQFPSKYRGESIRDEWGFVKDLTELSEVEMKNGAELYAAHQAETQKLVDTYKKLFDSCKTFKQLAEMWPETTTVFPGCLEPKKSTALIALSESELKFIRADSRKRMKEKAGE